MFFVVSTNLTNCSHFVSRVDPWTTCLATTRGPRGAVWPVYTLSCFTALIYTCATKMASNSSSSSSSGRQVHDEYLILTRSHSNDEVDCTNQDRRESDTHAERGKNLARRPNAQRGFVAKRQRLQQKQSANPSDPKENVNRLRAFFVNTNGGSASRSTLGQVRGGDDVIEKQSSQLQHVCNDVDVGNQVFEESSSVVGDKTLKVYCPFAYLPDAVIAHVASFLQQREHGFLARVNSAIHHALCAPSSWCPRLVVGCATAKTVPFWNRILSNATFEVCLTLHSRQGDWRKHADHPTNSSTWEPSDDQSACSQICKSALAAFTVAAAPRFLRSLHTLDLSVLPSKYLLPATVRLVKALPALRSLKLPLCKCTTVRDLLRLPASLRELHVTFDAYTNLTELANVVCRLRVKRMRLRVYRAPIGIVNDMGMVYDTAEYADSAHFLANKPKTMRPYDYEFSWVTPD